MDAEDKLKLIEEHAQEYYKSPRFYHFEKDGFILFELIHHKGLGNNTLRSIYFADMYVRESKSRSTLFKMVKHFVKLKNEHGLHSAFCRVEKVNKHYDKLVRMYKRLGFYEVHSDDQASYYKWV